MLERESFGQWLRHRRRELDLTQAELAQQVGCAPITVRKIEADQMRPSKQLALLLIERLGIAEDERENLVRFARGGEAVKPITVVEPRNNLPHLISSFIGREHEMAEVKRLLGVSRLVTLTGSGGCGKSRLAIETARQMLDIFPDGVWFAAFAPLADPTLVHQTIASALRVRENPGQSLIETLSAYLHSRDLLLVFDNCEHLIAECAQAADTLLQACPQLHILATSREPLNIIGEEQYYVPCLSLPVEAAGTPVERLDQSEAMRLFVDRGALVNSTFALTAENSLLIAEICRRLDGMPLAIELAAARLKALTVQDIAERLDDRFNLLTAGNRMALPRHQTLRAAIDWSYELLPESAQGLFRRLSVFAGGFTPEAARSICSAEGIAADDVLEELSRLVDRSLVEVVREERYRLLETIRQYARERLRESGQETPVRERHLKYFMSWAEEVEPKLRGSEQIPWMDRLETEHDNIRAALDWSLTGGDPQVGLRLADVMYWFWGPRAFLQEGFGTLKEFLARIPSEAKLPAIAKALLAAGEFAWELGTTEDVVSWYEQSLEYWRAQGDKWWTAYALDHLGWYYLYLRDPFRACSQFEDATACARATGDRWILAFSLKGLAAALERSDYSVARPILEESIAIWRDVGATEGLADALNQLGTVAHGENDDERAMALYEESLALFRLIRSRANVEMVLLNLGCAVQGRGDNKRAMRLFREALIIAAESGHKKGIADNIRGVGGAAGGQNEPQRAARLLGAAQSIYDSIGLDLAAWPFGRRDFERWVASAHTGLDDEAFAAAFSEGQAMTVEQSVAYALEGLEEG
jgi:predicted ATPase/DNA-binding XRE family transcriptional regulator